MTVNRTMATNVMPSLAILLAGRTGSFSVVWSDEIVGAKITYEVDIHQGIHLRPSLYHGVASQR